MRRTGTEFGVEAGRFFACGVSIVSITGAGATGAFSEYFVIRCARVSENFCRSGVGSVLRRDRTAREFGPKFGDAFLDKIGDVDGADGRDE